MIDIARSLITTRGTGKTTAVVAIHAFAQIVCINILTHDSLAREVYSPSGESAPQQVCALRAALHSHTRENTAQIYYICIHQTLPFVPLDLCISTRKKFTRRTHRYMHLYKRCARVFALSSKHTNNTCTTPSTCQCDARPREDRGTLREDLDAAAPQYA